MNDIVRITCKEGYIYHIIFDNGINGDVDFSEYLSMGPVFEPLKEITFFRKASIEGGTISWPNGADIAPETLYDKILQTQSEINPEHCPHNVDNGAAHMPSPSGMVSVPS